MIEQPKAQTLADDLAIIVDRVASTNDLLQVAHARHVEREAQRRARPNQQPKATP